MNASQNPLMWSFPLGRWFATNIRISWFFPLIAISFALRFGTQVGLTVAAILFFSTVAHELLGHILAVRLTGGEGDEILIWPLGGLAFVRPDDNFFSRFTTALAGPLVNLVICIATLPTAMMALQKGYNVFYPFALPIGEFSSNNVVLEVLVLVFSINFMLFLINLLPVYPLDGGQMLEAIVRTRTDEYHSKSICIRAGIIVGVVMMLISWIWIEQLATLMMISTFILILNVIQQIQLPYQNLYDDSFMGYDFSQGYTSLEKNYDEEEEAVRQSYFAKWKDKREQAKEEQKKEEAEALERDLDRLLEKVHKDGMDSLSIEDKERLRLASIAMQNRQQNTN